MRALPKLKTFLRICRDAAAWRPSHAGRLLAGVVGRRRSDAGESDAVHLHAAAAWLARAQDASPDGGFAGRYRMRGGWTSSYPETTGYIVPTLLGLADATGDRQWEERAARAVAFLLRVQLSGGGFPGMEIAENHTEPSIFNTGQILSGLTAWFQRTNDERARQAAFRAAEWMAAAQEVDGSWRRWIYGVAPYTYMAYAGGWLGRFGKIAQAPRPLAAAARHLEWVLSQRDADTGWFRHCGFSVSGHDSGQAYTHTIAYTIAGVLELARVIGHEAALAAARQAAWRMARSLELNRWLPGVLNNRWRANATFGCLTGNAQMALIWMDLHAQDHEPALLSAACKAIDLVSNTHPIRAGDPGIRGGIAGSDPVWGDYVTFTYPNWAAKYYIDALLAKGAALERLAPPPGPARDPRDVPVTLPAAAPAARAQLRVVLLAGRDEHKARQVAESCIVRDVTPTAIVAEHPPESPLPRRLFDLVRNEGFGAPVRRALRRVASWQAPPPAPFAPGVESLAAFCAARGIEWIVVERLDTPTALDALRRLAPDLAVHAGAGILRRDTIVVPRLGTLNAHMGLLPWFRGMNTAEWSFLAGQPVGCTVHLIDDGVDSGDILCRSVVGIDGVRSVGQLRDVVDRAQLALLGDVVAHVATTGSLPPRRAQARDAGRQYFRLHGAVRERLEAILAGSPAGSLTPAASAPAARA